MPSLVKHIDEGFSMVFDYTLLPTKCPYCGSYRCREYSEGVSHVGGEDGPETLHVEYICGSDFYTWRYWDSMPHRYTRLYFDETPPTKICAKIMRIELDATQNMCRGMETYIKQTIAKDLVNVLVQLNGRTTGTTVKRIYPINILNMEPI